MQVKLHNIIEVDTDNGTAHIIFNGISYEFDLDNVNFTDYCQEVVENTVQMYGGYAEYYYERPYYDSIEDYIEDETAACILQEILEDTDEKEFITYAKIIEE